MVKTTYAIHERKAIEKFRSHLTDDPGAIRMVLPLAEIAQLLRQGLSQLLHEAEVRLLLTIIENEVPWLASGMSRNLIADCGDGAMQVDPWSCMGKRCRSPDRAREIGRAM
ncbi:MAG: hypothetical protein NT090_03140 [Acidobacteria bacterium]|nr:hypothetical protein [Acidobacteriota bacterium]